jgi:molybdopterin molybdotransferase
VSAPGTAVDLMPFVAAQRAIVAACEPLSSERVPLDRALGRIAAEDVVATEMLVPYDRSAMDGFAVRAADAATGAVLALSPAFAAAGSAPPLLAPGTALPIATGAPLPHGADAVVPIEDTTPVADAVVRIDDGVGAGEHVFPAGEDALPGQLLVRAGTRLAPADLGVLAAAGIAHPAVRLQPRVTLLCTGDELVAIDAVPGYGQIRNSNATTLGAAITALGGRLVAVQRIADTEHAVRRALAYALATSDLVVTTGGASVGKRDYVKRIARELDVRMLFDTIAMRPSKPSAFGSVGFAHLAILPGNPAAAYVAFHELVRPALLALAGDPMPLLPRIRARLVGGSVRAKTGRTFCAFARIALAPEGFTAELLDNQCSSLTRTASAANGLVIVPDEPATFGPGDIVDVDLIDGSRLFTAG